jgi:hypothetical protein
MSTRAHGCSYPMVYKLNQKYISSEAMAFCYGIDQPIINIDKVITGNGFSTAFLKERVPLSHFNIIIAPNKAVIEEKQKAYKSGELNTDNRIGFFYQEGEDKSFTGFNVLMFVADSFLHMKYQLEQISDRINWVLIDEVHSVERQQTFRPNLVGLREKVSSIVRHSKYSSVKIATVTASPNKYSPVDVTIENTDIKPVLVHTTNSHDNSIQRARKLIKQGENVLVCTNNIGIIKAFCINKELRANVVAGDNLIKNIVGSMKFHDLKSDAGLFVISTKAFEGWDLYGSVFHVFYYEDRAREHTTFSIQNLYQAISRPRKGAIYIEYCRTIYDNRKSVMSKDKILKHISRKDLSERRKLKAPYNKFSPYIQEIKNKNGSSTTKFNEIIHGLSLEDKDFDRSDWFKDEWFSDFLQKRHITIKDLKEMSSPAPRTRTRLDALKSNLFKNRKWIAEKGIFDNHQIKVDTRNEYTDKELRTAITKYISQINYDGLQHLTDMQVEILDMVAHPKRMAKIKAQLVKVNNKYQDEWYQSVNITYVECRNAKATFKESLDRNFPLVLMGLVNKVVHFAYKSSANREFGVHTSFNIATLEHITKSVKGSILEVDVRSEFPRILYALLLKKPLPEGFYGANKMNKRAMNIALNMIAYKPYKICKATKELQKDSKGKFIPNSRNKSHQRIDNYNRLIRAGFEKRFADVLMDEFFEEPVSAVYDLCSMYEGFIIDEIKQALERMKIDGFISDGYQRRHDSLIIFNYQSGDLSFLNYWEFLNVGGWFEISEEYCKHLEYAI